MQNAEVHSIKFFADKHFRFSILPGLIAACLISCFAVGNMHARYISTDDSHAFTFDARANYYVTFNANGGEISIPASSSESWLSSTSSSAIKIVEADSRYGEFPLATRSRYALTGWNTKSDGSGENCDENTMAEANDIMLYAQWSPVEYTVTYHDNSNSSYYMPEGIDLPDEYQQLLYIEANGAQYIDTGYKPNQDTRVIFDGEITENKPLGGQEIWQTLYGCDDQSYSDKAFGAWFNDTNYNYGGVLQYGPGSHYGQSVRLTAMLGRRFIADQNKNNFSWHYYGESELQYTDSPAYTKFSAVNTLYLLDLNRNKDHDNILTRGGLIGKVYSVKIYDDGTLIRDYIPCLCKENNEAGLYDLQNNSFCPNNGSGAFIAGTEEEDTVVSEYRKHDEKFNLEGEIFEKYNSRLVGWNTRRDGEGIHYDTYEEVENLISDKPNVDLYAEWEFEPDIPEEYTLLSYLSTDGNQYIDTGFTPDQDTRVVFDGSIAENKATDTERFHTLYGCDDQNYQDKSFGAWFNDTSYSFYGVLQYERQSVSGDNVKMKAELGERFVAESNKNYFSWHYYGDEASQYDKSFSYKEFSAANTLYLFNLNRVSNHNKILQIGGMIGSFYSAQIYDDGVLVRDFFPVCTEDGTVGLFDTKNQEFYTNDGSGEFIPGPTVDGESLMMLQIDSEEEAENVPEVIDTDTETEMVPEAIDTDTETEMVPEATPSDTKSKIAPETTSSDIEPVIVPEATSSDTETVINLPAQSGQ